MRRLLHSRYFDRAMRGASLVVTDRRWAAPLSAAALGFGVFAGVAIGPGATGTLATGAQQILELPGSGRGEGQSGGGGAGAASTGSALPEGGEGGGLGEPLASSVPLAPEAVEPLPAPAPAPAAAPKPAPPPSGEEEAEAPETETLKGTVVQTSPAAGSYAMAIQGGELVSVHTAELPEPGATLSAPLRRLANGTFAAAGNPEQGKRTAKATFRGAVTFADPDPAVPAYTVSGRGSSLLVHVAPDPGGTAPALPAIGSYVTVTAAIEEPEEPQSPSTLTQSEIEVEPGPPSTYLDLAGIVREVLPETNQLLLSADWAGESESNLTLTVHSAIDAAKLEPGDSYLATAEVAEDGSGSLKLKGIASDEHTKGAEDSSSGQGDLKARP